jgi:Fanconi anemia group M protein
MTEPRYGLKPTIVPRLYQQRIFASCLKGNTLVVLPTGLGKTLIAAMLAVHKLNVDPGRKVVFLAPTKPLVMQHVKTFVEYTTIEPETIRPITGEIPADKRLDEWNAGQVCIMTPQTFENDVKAGALPLEDVSLVIMDEAHRAVGDYAYTWIAKAYMERAEHPHLLAMTASPGASIEKINEIRQNLSIENVEVRDEKDPDVARHTHATDIEWIRVDLPPEYMEIKRSLDEEYAKVIEFVKNRGLAMPGTGTGKGRGATAPASATADQEFTRKQLIEINRKLQEKVRHVADPSAKSELFSAIKILSVGLRLSYALELIETQGIGALSEYIKGCRQDAAKPDAASSLRTFLDIIFRKAIDEMIARLVKKGVNHPKMGELEGVLEAFFRDHPDSRVIVFANYRVTVGAIHDDLIAHGIDRVEKFVGQQTSGRGKGMSQKEQVAMLERFHAGEVRVLVATSVAEEGLDIGEVDLVVFYDVVPSAIRSIQRRGRTGRKRAGRVIVLIAKKTRDEAYQNVERYKERQMKENLGRLRDPGDNGKESGMSLDKFVPR